MKNLLRFLSSFLSLGVIVGALPNIIQNGQALDATPVYADLNFLRDQINANVPPLIPSLGTMTAWTPTIAFGGASVGVTYNQQLGQYVKTGPIVFFWFFMILSSKGASVGNASIGGLPFTVNAGLPGAGIVPSAVPNLSQVTFADKYVTLCPVPGATILGFTTTPSAAGGPNFLSDAAFTNTSAIHAAGMYIST